MGKLQDLLLHPKKGLNPRLTTCARCGGEGRDLLLLGKADYKDICDECSAVHYGGANKDSSSGRRACFHCGSSSFTRKPLEELEKVPHGLCQACEQEVALHKKLVEEGGIYWKCKDCGASGVIKDSPLSKHVREQLNIKAPEACGLEFSKSGGSINCPACGDENPTRAPDSEKD
jgi:hypothetical protein